MAISGVSGPSRGGEQPQKTQIENLQSVAQNLANELKDLSSSQNQSSALANFKTIAKFLAPYALATPPTTPENPTLNCIMGIITNLGDINPGHGDEDYLVALAQSYSSIDSYMNEVFQQQLEDDYPCFSVLQELLSNFAGESESSVNITAENSKYGTARLYDLITCKPFEHLLHCIGCPGALRDPVLFNMIRTSIIEGYQHNPGVGISESMYNLFVDHLAPNDDLENCLQNYIQDREYESLPRY